MLQSRELNKTIEFYRLEKSVNEHHETVEDWKLLKKVRSVVRFSGGNEVFALDQAESIVKVMIIIRPLKEINETMRIKYENEFYNIRYIQRERREYKIQATKVVK